MTITEGLTRSGRLFVYGALGLSLLIPVLHHRLRRRRGQTPQTRGAGRSR